MTTVSMIEARNRSAGLVDPDAHAEVVVVTWQGVPVVRPMPPPFPGAPCQPQTLAARIRKTRNGHDLPNADSLREQVEEGQR
jgi:antitoxin (DNA-binding transcriptional repressor) of toxin-antitoxin stability system